MEDNESHIYNLLYRSIGLIFSTSCFPPVRRQGGVEEASERVLVFITTVYRRGCDVFIINMATSAAFLKDASSFTREKKRRLPVHGGENAGVHTLLPRTLILGIRVLGGLGCITLLLLVWSSRSRRVSTSVFVIVSSSSRMKAPPRRAPTPLLPTPEEGGNHAAVTAPTPISPTPKEGGTRAPVTAPTRRPSRTAPCDLDVASANRIYAAEVSLH